MLALVLMSAVKKRKKKSKRGNASLWGSLDWPDFQMGNSLMNLVVSASSFEATWAHTSQKLHTFSSSISILDQREEYFQSRIWALPFLSVCWQEVGFRNFTHTLIRQPSWNKKDEMVTYQVAARYYFLPVLNETWSWAKERALPLYISVSSKTSFVSRKAFQCLG